MDKKKTTTFQSIKNPKIIIQSNQQNITKAVKTGYLARFGLAKRVKGFLGPGWKALFKYVLE